MKLPSGFRQTLEAALNRYLRLDPEATARMASLAGRCIAIELSGIDLTLFMLPDERGIRILENVDVEDGVDTTLHGTPLALARLGLGANTSKTLFSGDVTISGDVETGQAFKAILDDMDIDWEEQLSRLTGDIIAHQAGNVARRTRRVLSHGKVTLEQDLGDYLREELRVLPARVEVENFSADIDRIRTDTDRLAARIGRLQKTVDA
ncbi:MAG: SCP2 sterol-binding domain-containing protein [Gammaproteobacteria bacterium]|nr:SCP2 sterol-binding domain-containing protein [Gammaproteobacteria bacterium]